MTICIMCHETTSNESGFCSPECYDDYVRECAAIVDEQRDDEPEGDSWGDDAYYNDFFETGD